MNRILRLPNSIFDASSGRTATAAIHRTTTTVCRSGQTFHSRLTDKADRHQFARSQMVPARTHRCSREGDLRFGGQPENNVFRDRLCVGFAWPEGFGGDSIPCQAVFAPESNAPCLPVRSTPGKVRATETWRRQDGAAASNAGRRDRRLSRWLRKQGLVKVVVSKSKRRLSQEPKGLKVRQETVDSTWLPRRRFHPVSHVPAHVGDADPGRHQRHHGGSKAFGSPEHPNDDAISALSQDGARLVPGQAGSRGGRGLRRSR